MVAAPPVAHPLAGTAQSAAVGPLAVLFAVSAATSFVLAAYVARAGGSARGDRVSRWLVVLLVGAGWWSVCYLGRFLATGDAKFVWLTAEYVASGVIPVAWLVVAASYAGRAEALSTERVAALLVVPAGMVVLVATNAVHGLVWTVEGTADVGGATVLVREFTPVFYAFVAYSYACILVGAGLLVAAFRTSAGPYRGQIAALAGMVVAPAVGNVGFLTAAGGLSRIQFTSAGFTVTGALLVVSMFRYRTADLTPLGRAAAVQTMPDAVAVVDADRRVVNCNPAARSLFGVDATPLGRPLADVAPFDADALAPLFDDVERSDALAYEVAGGTRHFDVRVTPLTETGSTGWSVLCHETTTLRERNRELRHQNERLETFARIVSHDLRNPLNVAEGRLQLARERHDDEHLEAVADAHDRMGTLVDDLLALAQEGRTVDETAPVALAAVAERAWGTVDTLDATLSVDTDRVVEADEGRLRQLLENCYRNAVEHARPPARSGDERTADGGLTVTVGDCEGGFYVADDGPGIEPSVREDLFESGVTSRAEGTGLGLHIVEQVAAAHGWSVDATESADGGARFEFTGLDATRESPVECD